LVLMFQWLRRHLERKHQTATLVIEAIIGLDAGDFEEQSLLRLSFGHFSLISGFR